MFQTAYAFQGKLAFTVQCNILHINRLQIGCPVENLGIIPHKNPALAFESHNPALAFDVDADSDLNLSPGIDHDREYFEFLFVAICYATSNHVATKC